jgi:hypothetical protein
MDPNATLAAIRELINHDAQLPHDSNERDDSATLNELIEYFDALDQWLTKGGFLPSEWRKS